MMSEELKAIFAKKSEDVTEEDRKKVVDAINAFKKAVEDLCREHGLAYQSILNVTKDGIVPLLDVVMVKEVLETTKEANA